jgi:hypothetical protein
VRSKQNYQINDTGLYFSKHPTHSVCVKPVTGCLFSESVSVVQVIWY